MVAGAQTPQPEGQDNVGAMRQDRQRMAPQTQNTSSVAIGQVCRQTSEVGAVCGKAARTVLCGGRSVMGVPTAILRRRKDGNRRFDKRQMPDIFLKAVTPTMKK